jgi:hypothetical protein
MNAVEKIGPTSMPPALSETAAVLSLIERAARDPAVDIDKLERLLAMQKGMAETRAKVAFDAAMAEMQPQLPVIDRKGRIEVRKKDAQGERTGALQQSTPYALWEDINEAIRPILAAHGFSLTFRVGKTDAGLITVTGILAHREGHREADTITLQHDSTGSKNAVQAVGSSNSYGKRYTAINLLNITTRGQDDDGKAAVGPDTITAAQAKEIADKCKEVADGFDESFCNYFGIEKIADLPAKEYQRALIAIGKKKGAAK